MIANSFREATIDWQEKLQGDEWFFSNLQEDLLRNKSNTEIFAEIDDVIDLILEQKDKTLVYESFLLLFNIYGELETTEQTEKLKSNWNVLKEHICLFGNEHRQQFVEFERWFGSNWKYR